ncbi:hypothetical protein Raf01_91670 [Rugosimonospora africana]|uniref:Uncharacterized protein n=1 Tax=Rugosimonospora africana TaxID=556532 RepID=A0A8J3VW52_9ACTN|nr:hypothetical protein Raf01_91670 [Rugosimonospora africana]
MGVDGERHRDGRAPGGSRTLRRVIVSAVLGVLCLAGALVAIRDVARGAVSPHPKAAGPVSPSPLPGRIPIVRLIQPARLFWPGAVHTLPATLPDGSAYQVVAVLSADRYLVTTGEVSPAGATAVRVFDTGTRTVTTIAALPPNTPGQLQLGLPRNALLYPPLVDGDVVTWADTVIEGGSPDTEVWAADLTGGRPVRLTRIPGTSRGQAREVGQPRPVDGTVVWDRYAQSTTTGIYRVPATGGTPAPVPGTAGYDLVTGAWAQPAGRQVAGGAGSGDGGGSGDGAGRDELFDVLTGRRMRVPVGGVGHDERLECSPTWCAGAGVENISFAVVKADGSGGPTELDRPYRLADGGAVALAAGSDKHGNPQGVVVWNPTTGVWGGLDASYRVPDGSLSADVRVLQAQTVPGAPVEVFDLTVVGRPA